MKREHFAKVVEEALDSLPQEFRSRIRNLAVLIEDMPPNQPSPQSEEQRELLLGLFHGVPTTKKSIFALPTGPAYIVHQFGPGRVARNSSRWLTLSRTRIIVCRLRDDLYGVSTRQPGNLRGQSSVVSVVAKRFFDRHGH